MTYIETAIQKAIEGGWNNPNYEEAAKDMGSGDELRMAIAKMALDTQFWFLDPLFWQSLGKSLGWDDDNGNVWGGKRWLGFWHDFIDHLAEGRDAESFFESLLKQ